MTKEILIFLIFAMGYCHNTVVILPQNDSIKSKVTNDSRFWTLDVNRINQEEPPNNRIKKQSDPIKRFGIASSLTHHKIMQYFLRYVKNVFDVSRSHGSKTLQPQLPKPVVSLLKYKIGKFLLPVDQNIPIPLKK